MIKGSIMLDLIKLYHKNTAETKSEFFDEYKKAEEKLLSALTNEQVEMFRTFKYNYGEVLSDIEYEDSRIAMLYSFIYGFEVGCALDELNI